MTHPLDGPLAKVKRAKHHLEALTDAVDEFLRPEPYRTGLEVNPELSQKIVWIEVEPTPICIAIIAGDVAHNLRSALDHLVWQFAALDGKPTPVGQFPIFDVDDHFRNGRPRKSGRGTSGLNMIREVKNGDARALIEEVQPYNSAAKMYVRRGLLMLNKISNVDKHRVLLSSPSQSSLVGAMTREIQVFFGPYEGKAKLAVGPIALSDDDMKVEVRLQLSFYAPGEIPETGEAIGRDLDICWKAVDYVIRESVTRGIFPPPVDGP